jgi:LAS superfamily LD-carboxypeptidase LdcB
MQKIAMAANQNAALIRECWGFDCTYFDDDPKWLNWAKANPQSRLYLYYLPGSATQARALMLANKQPNLIVQKADTRALKALQPKTVAHNLVPLTYFAQRLNNAAFLEEGHVYQPSPAQTSTPSPPSSAFVPTPLEQPGGGRVRIKTDPKPQDVVNVPRAFGGKVPLHRVAAQAWQALVNAARQDGLEHPLLLPSSGYRSSSHQNRLWEKAKVRYGSEQEARKWVAPPGHSAHQSGRAIDFWLGVPFGKKHIAKQKQSRAYQWLVQNARRFGFYPYELEPWHWEYNPPANGQQLEFEGFEELGHQINCNCRECQQQTLEFEYDNEFSDIFQLPKIGTSVVAGVAKALGSNSGLRQKMVAIALQEWQRWGQGKIKESDPAMRAVLFDYWLTGANVRRSGKKWWSAHPWSAAFISWVIKKSGAGKSFRYSPAHASYIVWAKQNRLANNASPFKAYRLNEAKPRVGDLVCKARAGSGATYDTIARGMRTHCDIVIEVHPDHVVTIGGNVKQSVYKTPVKLVNGYINQANYFAVIRVENPTAAAPQPASPSQPRATTRTGGKVSSQLPRQYSWIENVVPLLERYRGDLPLDFLLGWIQIESGGKNATTTNLDERGFFQVHPDESKDYGFAEHERISRDPDYSIRVGIELVRRKAKRAGQLGFKPGTDLFNHAIKLLHWVPAGVNAMLEHMKAHGFAFADKSWQEFKQYVLNNQLDIQAMIYKRTGKKFNPLRGINNVDKLYAEAEKIQKFLH